MTMQKWIESFWFSNTEIELECENITRSERNARTLIGH